MRAGLWTLFSTIAGDSNNNTHRNSSKERFVNSLGVIVNPHSGKNLRSPQPTRDLREQLGHNGQFCLSQSVQELPEIIQELRANGMTTLAIDGGDGTIHQVINAAHKVYGSDPLPQIALLKGGTMNNIARNVGVPLLKRSHQLLAEVMTEQKRITVVRHSLLVDDKAGFIFGMGAVAQFLDLYELPPGRPTVTKAIRMVLKLLGSAIINESFLPRALCHSAAGISPASQPPLLSRKPSRSIPASPSSPHCRILDFMFAHSTTPAPTPMRYSSSQ